MADYIQFSAKTKNEAITKACIELETTSDQLEIQVISEGSSGFFGIGSKPAIIRARKIEIVSEEPELETFVETVRFSSIKQETVYEEPKEEAVEPVFSFKDREEEVKERPVKEEKLKEIGHRYAVPIKWIVPKRIYDELKKIEAERKKQREFE